jgi:glycosyltransferase involved in cell wall biosynthesis
MARVLAASPGPVYPRLPFLNGFCMLIKKRALKKIGLFDEKTFGAGYGEENDFALRATGSGWELAVADDAYVFHAQSKSYSTERRLELARNSDAKLVAKHGTSRKDAGLLACQFDRIMNGVRARAGVMLERDAMIKRGMADYEGKRVLFLLPIQGAGGGGHVVIQEAAAMRRMGVDAQIVNLRLHQPVFEREHPRLDVPVIYVDNPETDIDYNDYDAVIATHYMSLNWVRTILDSSPEIVPGYYIQDYEPFFYPPQSLEHMMARKSYKVPENTRIFVKTGWVHDTLLEKENLKSCIIGPSVESALFRPRLPVRPVQPTPLNLLAMVRPITPRRAPELTMRVLSRLAAAHGRSIAIHTFGCSEADPEFLKLERNFRYTNWGVLDREKAASLLSQTDIFADFSTFQAMGLTALEAMACGAAVIVPENGGAIEFANNEQNAIVIDTSDEEACFNAVDRLIKDRKLTLELQLEGMRKSCSYFPEKAALNILDELFT